MQPNNVQNNIEDSTNDNSQSIHNLIESIQTKLNSENQSSQNNTTDENMTQDTKETQNYTSQNNTQNNGNNNFDISSLLKNVDISSLLSGLSSGGAKKTNDNSSSFNLGDIDPALLSKFARIMSSMKKDDPKKDLLLSLKPFLRKSRQDKLSEYLTMLTIVNALDIFGSKGSD